ncbi:MAG: flagellar basal-body rod protein FlgG [Betaproteobacteria bacterium]|nr:flagellar basal-body rod protein FlgG [Betaproteobacteria bacterium]
MIEALHIAATGMQAQQTNLDTIANNLANVQSVGFKRSRLNFGEVVSAEVTRNSGAEVRPTLSGGAGVGVRGVLKVFDTGDMRKTASPLDLAVQGEGFFEVAMADGATAFTRGGTFIVNRDRYLALATGDALKAGIQVPEGADALSITAEGKVIASLPGRTGLVELGVLELVRFANPSGLQAQGDGLYRATVDSGEPILARNGDGSAGKIMQGYLEGSNVKLVDEFVNLMLAQRAYEASAKVIQAADEVLGLVNGLRK